MLFRELNNEEEIEFREWAREYYCPLEERSVLWHPVVRDEMRKIDEEVKKQC